MPTWQRPTRRCRRSLSPWLPRAGVGDRTIDEDHDSWWVSAQDVKCAYRMAWEAWQHRCWQKLARWVSPGRSRGLACCLLEGALYTVILQPGRAFFTEQAFHTKTNVVPPGLQKQHVPQGISRGVPRSHSWAVDASHGQLSPFATVWAGCPIDAWPAGPVFSQLLFHSIDGQPRGVNTEFVVCE